MVKLTAVQSECALRQNMQFKHYNLAMFLQSQEQCMKATDFKTACSWLVPLQLHGKTWRLQGSMCKPRSSFCNTDMVGRKTEQAGLKVINCATCTKYVCQQAHSLLWPIKHHAESPDDKVQGHVIALDLLICRSGVHGTVPS